MSDIDFTQMAQKLAEIAVRVLFPADNAEISQRSQLHLVNALDACAWKILLRKKCQKFRSTGSEFQNHFSVMTILPPAMTLLSRVS